MNADNPDEIVRSERCDMVPPNTEPLPLLNISGFGNPDKLFHEFSLIYQE